MTNNPVFPIVPPADDDETGIADGIERDGERPLDPDLDEEQFGSAEADEQAAREGELDGDVDDRP